MQTQTLIITTEAAQACGVNFTVTVYELKISAFCDCCSAQASGTAQQLESAGWELNPTCQFCPTCNA